MIYEKPPRAPRDEVPLIDDATDARNRRILKELERYADGITGKTPEARAWLEQLRDKFKK